MEDHSIVSFDRSALTECSLVPKLWNMCVSSDSHVKLLLSDVKSLPFYLKTRKQQQRNNRNIDHILEPLISDVAKLKLDKLKAKNFRNKKRIIKNLLPFVPILKGREL
jgi:hypothetical protein